MARDYYCIVTKHKDDLDNTWKRDEKAPVASSMSAIMRSICELVATPSDQASVALHELLNQDYISDVKNFKSEGEQYEHYYECSYFAEPLIETLYQRFPDEFIQLIKLIRDSENVALQRVLINSLMTMPGIPLRGMFSWDETIKENMELRIQDLEFYALNELDEEKTDKKKCADELVRVLREKIDKGPEQVQPVDPKEAKAEKRRIATIMYSGGIPLAPILSPAQKLNNLIFKMDLLNDIHKSDHVFKKSEYRGGACKFIGLVLIGLCLPPLGIGMLVNYFFCKTTTQKQVKAIHKAADFDDNVRPPEFYRSIR